MRALMRSGDCTVGGLEVFMSLTAFLVLALVLLLLFGGGGYYWHARR